MNFSRLDPLINGDHPSNANLIGILMPVNTVRRLGGIQFTATSPVSSLSRQKHYAMTMHWHEIVALSSTQIPFGRQQQRRQHPKIDRTFGFLYQSPLGTGCVGLLGSICPLQHSCKSSNFLDTSVFNLQP